MLDMNHFVVPILLDDFPCFIIPLDGLEECPVMMDGLGFYPDADLEYHPRTKEPRSQTEEHACEPPDPAQLDRSESGLEELHRE